jgi:hypothetical protein
MEQKTHEKITWTIQEEKRNREIKKITQFFRCGTNLDSRETIKILLKEKIDHIRTKIMTNREI